MGLFNRRSKPRPSHCSAIVVAAGQSSRMEGLDKILLPLDGIPVLVYCLRNLAACDNISELIVVTRQDLLVPISELVKEYGLSKVSKILVGGADRMESVWIGLQEVNEKAELIAIHDGARPFASMELIGEVVQAAAAYHAAAPSLVVRDSMRRVKHTSNEIVDREGLVAIQTPQVFDADLIRAAYVKARQDGAACTDDCSVAEYLGMKIHLTVGDPRNIKLTSQQDIPMLEGIAQAWEDEA